MLIEVQQVSASRSKQRRWNRPSRSQAINQLPTQTRSNLACLVETLILPKHDTLNFTQLEAWHLTLQGCVWDPNSLSSFWFELVNGAYGDVYRAKALMNLPDGRSFFCNWMVSQESSQFLPLEAVEPLTSRPNRISHLVVQGKALDHAGIQSTINDCLLADDVLEMQQAQLRQQQQDLQPTR